MEKVQFVLNIVKKVFTILVIAVAVFVMLFTVVSVSTFNRNDRNILGCKVFIVLSDSMKATDFAAGDLVVVKSVDPTTLEVGDIISYTSQNPENYGETVTHKIRALTYDSNGERGFITYGTTTGTDDATIVTYPYVNGKYLFRIAKMGTFFNFLKTVPGYIICILIPFLILIGMQALNTVKLFRKYKKQQMKALKKERMRIEAEKKQSEALLAELQMLKAQLKEQGAVPATQEAAPTEAVTEESESDDDDEI